jgi:hypothetical protein
MPRADASCPGPIPAGRTAEGTFPGPPAEPAHPRGTQDRLPPPFSTVGSTPPLTAAVEKPPMNRRAREPARPRTRARFHVGLSRCTAIDGRPRDWGSRLDSHARLRAHRRDQLDRRGRSRVALRLRAALANRVPGRTVGRRLRRHRTHWGAPGTNRVPLATARVPSRRPAGRHWCRTRQRMRRVS